MDGTPTIDIIDYDDRYALATVKMWRASMEQALGITDQHSWDEQVDYLRHIVQVNRVYLAIDADTDSVVGMLAIGGTELAQLYIHVDYQGQGIGTRLLNIAKTVSPDTIQLYTFEVNTKAQAFYERHGFKIIGRGVEAESGMADIRYEWTKR